MPDFLSILESQNRFVATLSGSSMHPLLKNGDLIEVQKSPRLKPGEIILFRFHEMLVAHRIVRIEGAAIIAKGDAIARLERIEAAQVLGKVVSYRRNNRTIRTDSGWVRLYGRLLPWSALLLRGWNRISGRRS